MSQISHGERSTRVAKRVQGVHLDKSEGVERREHRVVARERAVTEVQLQLFQLSFSASLRIDFRRLDPSGADPLAGCPNVGNQFLKDAHEFSRPECGLTPAFLPMADSRYPPASSFDSIEIEMAHVLSHQQCRQLVAVSLGQHELAEHEVELFPEE
jgi:hypothetical protein